MFEVAGFPDHQRLRADGRARDAGAADRVAGEMDVAEPGEQHRAVTGDHLGAADAEREKSSM